MGCTLIDEAAFGSEPDAIIPMSLGASKNQLSGDHEQLHPVVKSAGHSEFSNQHSISMFERFYGHHSAALVRFKINFRMVQLIAQFPGIIGYGYLASDASTLVKSAEYRYYDQWWNSDSAKSYRDARRSPEYGGAPRDQNQRIFINVKGGKSAPKVGGKSKRNFANINAICDFVMNLFAHQSTIEMAKIDLDKITILTPYKEELREISKQIKLRLRFAYPKIQRFPRLRTIDSTQGGENEIVLLAITPADQHNGCILGFLKQ